MNLISKKKVIYPISDTLRKYLRQYGRDVKTTLRYSDLMDYENFLTVYDRDGNNSYWITVIYNHSVADEINEIRREFMDEWAEQRRYPRPA